MSAEEMTAAEIDAFLDERGSGVLAFANDGESAAIPVSFGYDGDAIYVQLVYDEGSRKMTFVETTETASLTTYTETPAASVVARGPLAVVEDDELLATAAIAENAAVPALNVSAGEPLSSLSFDYYRLDPTELTGRRFDAGMGVDR